MAKKKKARRKASPQGAAKTRRRAARPAKPEPESDVLEVALVPVRNMVLFPGVVLPLMIGREPSLLAVQDAVERQLPVGLVLQRDETQEQPSPADLHQVGTLVELMRYWTSPEGGHHAICQGQARFVIEEILAEQPFPRARVRMVAPAGSGGRAIQARFRVLRQRASEVLALAPGAPEELGQAVQKVRATTTPQVPFSSVSTRR